MFPKSQVCSIFHIFYYYINFIFLSADQKQSVIEELKQQLSVQSRQFEISRQELEATIAARDAELAKVSSEKNQLVILNKSLKEELAIVNKEKNASIRQAADAENTHQQEKGQLLSEIATLSKNIEEELQNKLDIQSPLEDALCQKQDIEHQLRTALIEKQDSESKLEGKTKELAAHNTEVWRVPSSKVSTMGTIGTGGWGEVLEGTLRVAVKRIYTAILNQRNLERLQREMKLLAEVRHPNLVQFIGAVFDRSPPLIITELLDINLRQAYEQNQLGPGDRLSIFTDVARALDYLHQRYESIIHRDVSAPNVLLQRMPNNQWKGKVSDLGSANFLKDSRTMGEGAIVYSPPEVFPQKYNPKRERTPQTTKIDVYSYGVLLCEVVTSRFPSDDNYWDMFESVQRDYPQLHALIEHCTHERPDDRPTMEAVLQQLNKKEMPQF